MELDLFGAEFARLHRKLGHIRRRRDTNDRRRVLLDVDDRATALGWSFFDPLITQMVTAAQSFDETELATVWRFLRTMADVIADQRAR